MVRGGALALLRRRRAAPNGPTTAPHCGLYRPDRRFDGRRVEVIDDDPRPFLREQSCRREADAACRPRDHDDLSVESGCGVAGAWRARKSMVERPKTSLRSPATMWPAFATFTYSLCGTGKELLHALFADDVGTPSAHQQGRQRQPPRASRQPLMPAVEVARAGKKRGSQCHRYRPSSPSRTFLARPSRLRGRPRCGW